MDNRINEGELTKKAKTLVLQGHYEEALETLEELDLHKIKNTSILCLVGEAYMGLERYDEAERVLLRVYEKQPNTRRILDLVLLQGIYRCRFQRPSPLYSPIPSG